MKIVSAAEMREIDRISTEKFGVPSLALMENAGKAVADHVLDMQKPGMKILVVCGKGNNGGDGFVAARLMAGKQRPVEVILLADPSELKGDAAIMYSKLPKPATVVRSSEELKTEEVRKLFDASFLVDAILGTGFKPPVTGLYADAIALLNASRGTVVSVDIPSGADADAMTTHSGLVARSDLIVTFTALRPAHAFTLLPKDALYVAPIGSPDEAVTSSLHLNVIHPQDFTAVVGPRPSDSNKGNYGHVLVIGGSVGKAGAAAMAGMSALRAGAGLSTVATPKSVLNTVAGFYPELMTEPLPETDSGTIATNAGMRIDQLLKSMTVAAIGPGISRDPHTATLVRSLVTHHTIPMVVDADGLNAFEHHAAELNGKGRTLVITPHPGEMARLCDCSVSDVQKDRLGTARRFARGHELIVVLKGHRTLVAQPDGEAWVNLTGNPGMATGGTGDILTGMVAAMIAQHPKDPMMAVCAAVYLHGRAGDLICRGYTGQFLVATDLLGQIASAFQHASWAANGRLVGWGEFL